ncbi:cytoplasmic polyadenylation element-binding protein 2 isoform X2 [Odontomachus brunneus]|uniref:cytoplasmic polyadenylation element-binding protein 2 isoform X2 n=1 Tax=Odontomachus brunneus TaxID=486640 RepID=UPI0013F24A4B|nr:cytoplasmic polyadenylation element-binding protein 2 isoform X2 [Odontomachus brunneus]
MGDLSATSLFSRTSSLTSQKLSATSSSSSNTSVNITITSNNNHNNSNVNADVIITTSTMQDDLLIEKQAAGKPAPLSPSSALDTVAGQDKSKDVVEVESIAITPTTPSSTEKDITCSTSSSLQGFADPGRVPSLWSAPDDSGLHALPVNGSIAAFQNFPTGGPAGLFASTGAAAVSSGTRRAITASHNFPQQQQQQHGNAGAPAGTRHGGLQVSSAQQQQQQQQQHQQQQQQPPPTSHPGVYLPGKGYAAWSGGPQAPQQWGAGPQAAAAAAAVASPAGLSPWSRGRSVPNLPPLHSSLHAAAAVAAAAGLQGRKPSPTFPGHPGQAAHPSCISPVKFRRSTSYPGKGNIYPPQPAPTFEVTAAEERDLLQLPPFQQDRMTANGNSPLDNMRTLEHYLSDIMRAGAADTQEHLKGFINCNANTLQSLAQLHGKSPFFPSLEDQSATLLEDPNAPSQLDGVGVGVGVSVGVGVGGGIPASQAAPLSSPSRSSPHSQGSETGERFSRKVFVGGLPPDIDEDEITASFRRFGPLVVDWPHKAESKSYFPPKGYAFLLFQDEGSVQQLIDACIQDEDKLYLCVSSPTIKDKPVQIRPWRLSDADFVLDASMPLDPRKTVFVGGVPRPLKAVELAMIMDRLYGGVCYAGIDTDPELKYPKGAGRVAFSNQQSYIAAISARFVQLQHGDIDKRVEVKPYVLDDQMCDECQGQRCGGKFAPFFCANVTCLQYYCEHCWATIHSRPGREFHKPLVKEGADRPRAVPFRWC